MDDSELEQIENEEGLEIMSAEELMAGNELVPQKTLLGELWREGELAVMFGDTGSGKSLFAVQIADAIASGYSIYPFEMTAGEQKVLLLDLGQTSEQFRRRYTSEPDPETGEVKRCEFPPNLIHVSLKGSVQMSVMKIAPIIERTGAKVVIIDSLAFLQRYALPRETVVVMRELRRLQKRYRISILVVMNTARVVHRRGIVSTDIQCSSVVTSFADNIFAMGRSGSRSNVRYLKHIKNCLEDTLYSAAHVPYFKIVRQCGNFPSMHFIGYASEMSVRAEDNDHWEWDRLRTIKKLYEKKKNLRAVADELGVSKSTAHRLLKIAESAPPLPSPTALVEQSVRQFYTLEKCIVEGCHGCFTCKGRAANNYRSTPGSIRGHDGDCPDDCDLCGPRKYAPNETVDPELKRLSDNHYANLRAWLIGGKQGPKPTYPNARRYGVEEACWRPGSENWTAEQLAIYDKWVRNGQQGREPDVNGARAGP